MKFFYILIAIIGLLYFFGSLGKKDSDSNQPPIINWSNYAEYKKIGVEKSIDERSCAGLQRAHDASKKSEMMIYIDWHLEEFGCYK